MKGIIDPRFVRISGGRCQADGRQKLFAVLTITCQPSVAVGNRTLNQIFCNFQVDIAEMVSV